MYVLLTEDDAELVLKATSGVRPDGVLLDMGFEGAPVAGRGVYADLGGSPYNLPALRAAGIRSLVTAPFVVDGRGIGLLIAASRDAAHFNESDVERLQQVADRQAPSLEHARLMELERARRGWLGFLAEASSLLAGTLDQQMTMALVAQLIVPAAGDLVCGLHRPRHRHGAAGVRLARGRDDGGRPAHHARHAAARAAARPSPGRGRGSRPRPARTCPRPRTG